MIALKRNDLKMVSSTDQKKLQYPKLIEPAFLALKNLGGSGNNEEILNEIIAILNLPDEAVDFPHLGSANLTELAYQAAWARTYLKNYGIIENSSRSVWSIRTEYASVNKVDGIEIYRSINQKSYKKKLSSSKIREKNSISGKPEDDDPNNNFAEFPDEIKPWREKLAEVLEQMNPYAFERLS